jgi:hypothetical protein
MAIVERGAASPTRRAEFLHEGLCLGQWCCWLAPAALHPGMVTRLRELGRVDVERHLHDQTLQFPPDAPDADQLLDWAKSFFARAEAAHAPAIRWLEEGIWPQRGISGPQFFALHTRLNYLVKHYPSVAVCQYDAERLEIPNLFSAIAVHRHLLVEGTLVRDHPFYIPAEKFLALTPEDRERDLRDLFREVGFDLEKMLSALAGYGQLQRPAS